MVPCSWGSNDTMSFFLCLDAQDLRGGNVPCLRRPEADRGPVPGAGPAPPHLGGAEGGEDAGNGHAGPGQDASVAVGSAGANLRIRRLLRHGLQQAVAKVCFFINEL